MEHQKYIKASAVYNKLREAENAEVPIYLSGAVAFGKTAAVQYFYRRKGHLILSGEAGCLEQMPLQSEIKERVIIFDDISWIEDSKSQEYIVDTIRNRKNYGQHVVLIGRSSLPGWLRVTAIQEVFHYATEKDMALNRDELNRFLTSRNITASEEELQQLMKDSIGYPLSLVYAAYHLTEAAQKTGQPEGSCGYCPAIQEQAKLDLFHYFDHAFYEKWDSQMRKILLDMCQYETFTVKLMEMVTCNNRVPILLEKAFSVGTFLTKLDEETYAYRPLLREYFKWKQTLLYTQKEIAANYTRAALYYTLQDDVEQALACYKKAGDEDKISELLIKNARKHPGTAHFFETREYYFSLPEEKIKESPVLMSGISILYSIMFQPEKSDYWYGQLEEYQKKARYSDPERKEAIIRLAYLNIALAHRGIHGMVQILKDTAILCRNQKIKMPEFSVTSNLPSIINGGLDFSEWSKCDKELGIVLKRPVEIVLGKYGVGFVNIALAEIGMEKETMDSYEIMTRLNNGYLMSETGGKIEICFAAVGLLIKEHLSNGQPEIAENLYEAFRRKAVDGKADYLLPNMDTLFMWMHLREGDTAETRKWLQTAPDDMYAFNILDRYQYINKVRVFIALGRYEEALALIERLMLYFVRYERHYLRMESQILKAIALYRKGMDEWRETLAEALQQAEPYHFVKIFTMEGNALKPLMDKLPPTGAGVDPEYFQQINRGISQMALYYPRYLKEESIMSEPLTDTEARILKLLCKGTATKEICVLCSISYSGLKFHIRNIYKKMGVKSRSDAEREAKKLGLDK